MTTFLNSLARSVRTVLRRLGFLLETPLVYVFGRDIFISYARADAANYAQQLAIAVRGEVPKLSFFLDQWASMSGTTLPLTLRLALRWSQLLVFVGTQNAIDSAHVRLELEAFFNRKGRFVPIDVGGVLHQALRNDKFLSAICGPGAVPETSEYVAKGTPSKDVVTRIVNAVTFTRQDRRLRRAVVATTLGVIAIIGTAYFFSQSLIANARAQEAEAKRQVRIAADQRTKALADMGAAQFAAATAQSDQLLARMLAKDANEQAKRAETLRVAAERLRDQARAEAARQSEIVTAQQRANQSELMLQRSPARFADSVSLAIESMNRAHAAGIYSLEADRALRGSLSLLSRSLGSKTIDDVISVTALSPDGQYVGFLRKSPGADGAAVLRIVNGAASRELGSFASDWRYIALSNDVRRFAISNGRTVETREVSGNGKWVLRIPNEDDYVTGLALSPNGKYFALMMRNSDAEDGTGFGEIFEVESGNRVTRLQSGTLAMNSVAFSASGQLLAIAGRGYAPGGKPMGRALIWNLRNYAVNETLHENHFRQRTELLQNEEIHAIAAGRDERFVATASGRFAAVWRKNPGGYHEIARMPIERPIDELAFTPDGKYLHVLSGGVCENLTIECRRRFLERWESTGYWQNLTTPHSEPIESITFRGGNQFISTITSSYGDGNRHLRRVSDGVEIKNLNVRSDENVPDDSSSPDIGYFAKSSDDAWYVSNTLSDAKIPVKIEDLEEDRLEHPSLTPDGSLLVFAGKKKGQAGFSVFVYKRGAESYVLDRSFPVAAYPASLAISPDKIHVAVHQGVTYNVSYDRLLKVFDSRNGNERTPDSLAKLTDVESFVFAPDGKSLAVLFSGRVGVWRLRDGRQISVLQNTGESYSFNRAGDRLAVAMRQDSIELLDVRTGKVTMLPTNSPIRVVAFSADGQFLATADAKGLVTLIQLSTLDEVASFQHENNVTQIVFSRDGKYLATATEFPEDQARPDEAYLLHVWLLRPQDLIKEACQRLTRLRETPLSYCATR